MKKIILWVLAALFAFACITTLLSSCSKSAEGLGGDDSIEDDSDDNTATVVIEGGEDEVTESLLKAPGLVKIRKEVRSEQAGEMANVPVYFCYFTQLVDHNDPSKGTFEQKVAITMNYPFRKGEPVLNILHTQGYNTPDTADEVWTTGMHFPVYYVQAVLELGTYSFSYSFLDDGNYITQQDMLDWQKDNASSDVEYPEYASRYNGKMMADFLKNLNTTEKKMVFVYGGNDPWTGAAVPNSVTSNPNVKKFIIPLGTHNDDILSDENWESKGEEIYDAINDFLLEIKEK